MRIAAGTSRESPFPMTGPAEICIVLMAVALSCFSQDSLTLLFPSKDGHASPDSFSGDRKELIVDEETQTVGWIAFNKYLVDFKNVKSAMFMLHIKTVEKRGLCGIFALLTRVEPPEKRVTLGALQFDDMPIAAIPLDSSSSDQIIPLDITESLRLRRFNGIAIRSMNGLSANFSSKEGALPPSIVLMHGPAGSESVSWFNGTREPDSTTGKSGDFFVRTSNGIIYHKTNATWDSVAILAVLPVKHAIKTTARKSVRTAAKKRTARSPAVKKKQISR